MPSRKTQTNEIPNEQKNKRTKNQIIKARNRERDEQPN